MRTLVDDLLPQIRPGYVSVFTAYRAIKLAYLASDICQFTAIGFESALAIRAVEAIDFLHRNIHYLHYCLSLLSSQKNRLYRS